MSLKSWSSRWSSGLLALAVALGGSVTAAATPEEDLTVAATDDAPTNVAIAVPITVPARTTGLITPDELAEYTTASGTLTRQLDAVAGRPVALGIDPMIIASIRVLGSAAPDSAVQWLSRLQWASNETFALAWADADVAALRQAGIDTLAPPTDFALDPALFPDLTTVSPSPSPSPSPDETEPGQTEAPDASGAPTDESDTTEQPEEPDTGGEGDGEEPINPVPTGAELMDLPFSLPDIAWPRSGTLTADDVDALAVHSEEQGDTALLIDGAGLTHSAAETQAAMRIGDANVLAAHPGISDLFRTAASATTDATWLPATEALTASLVGWAGGRSTVLLTLDRTAAPAFRLAATLDLLAANPELALTPLSTALPESPVAAELIESPVDADRVVRLQAMLATEPATTEFATVLSDPTLITADQRRRILALSSNAWTATPTEWATATDEFVVRAGELLKSVHVVESSTINLLSDTGDLPITVSNSLPYPVTVNVSVNANTAVLDVLEGQVPVTIEPESQARAAIPVQSIANGTALLSVRITSTAGVNVGNPVYITTNVQAGWETAFTAVLAAVVLLIFIGGIVRTVVRRRRQRREDAPVDSTLPQHSSNAE